MPGDTPFLHPKLPHLFLDVVGGDESGELHFRDRDKTFRVVLRKRLWKVFEILLEAQLTSTPENPYSGFRTAQAIADLLVDTPLSSDVPRYIDRLRTKLSDARFRWNRSRQADVQAFRMDIIETQSLGYRLSIPCENIKVWRVSPSTNS
jgi:hypothetical protein